MLRFVLDQSDPKFIVFPCGFSFFFFFTEQITCDGKFCTVHTMDCSCCLNMLQFMRLTVAMLGPCQPEWGRELIISILLIPVPVPYITVLP